MTHEAHNSPAPADPDARHLVTRFVLRARLYIVRWVCRMLLPRHVWVGKHFGVYTQRFDVVFGVLDNRGVLQGRTARELGA
jgi:hypothetical protein